MKNRDNLILENIYRVKILKEYSENDESGINFFNSRSSISDFNIGPVYHGGGWNGINAPLVRDGEYGTGIYFTTSKDHALSYTKADWKEIQGAKASKTQYLIEARLRIKKPIVLEKDVNWPEHNALVQLGMKPEKAEQALYKVQERTGNTGSIIRKRGESLGYDGILFHRNNDMDYYIVWQPYNVMVTNVEKL